MLAKFKNYLSITTRMPKSVIKEKLQSISLMTIRLKLLGYRVIEDKNIPKHNLVAMHDDKLYSYDLRTNQIHEMHKDQFIKTALNRGWLGLAEKITNQKFIIKP